MSNALRAEVDVTLEGRTRPMRATFHALIEIEEKTGVSVAEILRRICKAT